MFPGCACSEAQLAGQGKWACLLRLSSHSDQVTARDAVLVKLVHWQLCQEGLLLRYESLSTPFSNTRQGLLRTGDISKEWGHFFNSGGNAAKSLSLYIHKPM